MSSKLTFKPCMRVIIEKVNPEIDSGRLYAKRAVGEECRVSAVIFADGHEKIAGDLLWRKSEEKNWNKAPLEYLINDRWEGMFIPDEIGMYEFTLEAWIDEFFTWSTDLVKRYEADQKLDIQFQIGLEMINSLLPRLSAEEKIQAQNTIKQIQKEKKSEKKYLLFQDETLHALFRANPHPDAVRRYETILPVRAQRQRALFSSWYELFPRSTGEGEKHGTFKDLIQKLPTIKEMGFDILYLPPIHPIGKTHRKGKNNVLAAEKGDPGSPWAIGSEEGGHDAIHAELGTLKDFKNLVKETNNQGLDLALDLAFQCSPDHPYVKEHPEWFQWRPDGTVQFAENPPKKYEDIIPINFSCENWKELWMELRRIVLYWVEQGVRVFRVDNPHTKPFAFWQWLIREVHEVDPEVIFLSEAFTRPSIMQYLSKIGFDQSYTYFTWRNTKAELTQYLTELTKSPLREYFRPNFWPNTPDILPEYLQFGGRAAFISRLVLASTLSSNYGIYGPAFELLEHESVEHKEEYFNSEKYEIKNWDPKGRSSIRELITIINDIRQKHSAFQTTWNIQFCDIQNDMILAYLKFSRDETSFLILVNLDPHYNQSGWVELPLEKLGIKEDRPYMVHDQISNQKFIWEGKRNYIELDPSKIPVHILAIRPHLHREHEFDYFT